tara:strand:- start:479 stop:1426 length:948 start_codon:yes stop_codon:yes gene_type:complete
MDSGSAQNDNPDMSKASFQVVYDGPALASHEMEVRDLAPALLAMGDLFEEAGATLNPSGSKISVKVNGSFKTGCFAIDLTINQSLYQQAIELFTSDAAAAALNILAFVGFAGSASGGVFGLIKWLRGRRITNVEILDNGKVKVFCDSDLYETEQQVLDLFRNWKVRKAFEDVVRKPLQSEGVDHFAIKLEGSKFVSVSQSEAEYFVAPEQDEERLDSSERVASLQLVNVPFRDDNKWRFYDGAATFYAAMLDEPFLHRVEQGIERFGKGDILKVKLQEEKTLAGETLKAVYSVIEVLEHRQAAAQLNLPMSKPDA